MFEDYISDIDNAIIMKVLISESPLQSIDNIPVPTIEKILVDLLAEVDLFYFSQGTEMLNFYRNALEKYTIHMGKLSRYAARRNKRDEVKKIVTQIQNSNKNKK